MSNGVYSKLTGYHNRRSIRLPGYDYSQPGYYFVTVCIHDRTRNFFGDIVENKMILNDFGSITQNEILQTEQMRPNVIIDEYAIMPNHCHIIFHLYGHVARAPTCPNGSQTERFGKPTTNSIPTIVRLTKSTITKQINILRTTPGNHVWQRNYYEHIIRDEKSLFYIRKYIAENPNNWMSDIENHIEREFREIQMTEIKETL